MSDSEEIVTIGRKGEVVLPEHVRDTLGFKDRDELVLTIEGDTVVLRRRLRGFGAYLASMTRKP